MPKSQLQWYGECVYSTATEVDLLNNINNGKTALERLISVVAWSISTTRPQNFGVAPYNPILGETHHVSKGNLNVLIEQVHCYFMFRIFENFTNYCSLYFAGFTPSSGICISCH